LSISGVLLSEPGGPSLSAFNIRPCSVLPLSKTPRVPTPSALYMCVVIQRTLSDLDFRQDKV